MLSIFVTINVMEEYLGEFMSASLADSEGSVCNEPSCYRFDINQDEAIPTRFYLYEVYSDEEAFQYHLTTSHFLTWKEQIEPWMIGEPEILRMKTIFPSPAGWNKQKPALIHF